MIDISDFMNTIEDLTAAARRIAEHLDPPAAEPTVTLSILFEDERGVSYSKTIGIGLGGTVTIPMTTSDAARLSVKYLGRHA